MTSRFRRGLMRLNAGTTWRTCLRRARGVLRWGRDLLPLWRCVWMNRRLGTLMEHAAFEGIVSRSDAVRAAVRERPIASNFIPVLADIAGLIAPPMRLSCIRVSTS